MSADEQLRMALGTGKRLFKGTVRKDKIVLFLVAYATEAEAWDAAEIFGKALRNLTAEKLIEFALYDLAGESPPEGSELDYDYVDADPTIDWLSRSGVGVERDFSRALGETWKLCLYTPREWPPLETP